MTYTASLLPIVDALVALITLPVGMTADASGSAPVVYAPNTLYVWPRMQRPIPGGDGSLDDIEFSLRVAWSVSGGNEEDGQLRLRAVSDALDAGVKAVVDAVRDNRTNAVWEAIQVDTVTYDAVVTFDVRAAWLDISGYRYISS